MRVYQLRADYWVAGSPHFVVSKEVWLHEGDAFAAMSEFRDKVQLEHGSDDTPDAYVVKLPVLNPFPGYGEPKSESVEESSKK